MSLRLQVISNHGESLGPNFEKEFAGTGGTIGRSLDNDWALPDSKRYLSSRHAMIECRAGDYYLIDTSRNGIYVNDSDDYIGRGQPLKLSDGDTIRLGDYLIKASVIKNGRDFLDTMQDSIVRAQLVQEDESMEIPLLIPEDKIQDDMALERLLQPGNATGELSALSEKVDVVAVTQEDAANSLLAAAGLQPEDVPGMTPTQIIETAGELLKEFAKGASKLSKAQTEMAELFDLAGTANPDSGRNPLKLSPGLQDTLKYLLGSDGGDSFIPPQKAVQELFSDLSVQQQAVLKAMSAALGEYIEKFDPEALEKSFDSNGSSDRGNWSNYALAYRDLTQNSGQTLPQSFGSEFARAYSEQLQALRNKHSH
jgi:type VI secretion system protein ImpI